jgi:hypothetical protein
MLVVLIILFIARLAGYQAIDRTFDPRPVQVLRASRWPPWSVFWATRRWPYFASG